jgi:ribosomal-protein-alanine N-acetyltransferase
MTLEKTITPVMECRRLSSEIVGPLSEFLTELACADEEQYFHPHSFTSEELNKIISHCEQDIYVALVRGSQILGYGMLRGWDEGFSVPSLGIAISSKMQGQGLGRALMEFLHAAARMKGANQVRLACYKQNLRAMSLYQSLGYAFVDNGGEQLVGFKEL